MLTRGVYLHLRGDGPEASLQLEQEGYAVLRGVLSAREVRRLRCEIESIFDAEKPKVRIPGTSAVDYAEFRHGTYNKSAAAQQAIAHPRILEVIEPLLGEDCHLIANTSWRNAPNDPADVNGSRWHLDAGPHVPRPAGVEWDDRIPYPVFALGAHILLQDCPRECGPTGVLARTHRSGQPPPRGRKSELGLLYDGRGPVPLTGDAGDVALFVSDVWHRRLPPVPSGDQGRFFLQAHYARRDIAQRVELTKYVNHVSPAARRRARTRRERTLIGLHPAGFYDA